jgi:4-amino-4-deoxy-L-arabinose transferase-like glycosyltransferase
VGGISQAVAQVYHVLFFILLVWLTFILGKERTGERKRWYPALIVATVPMVVSFSTLFYMDVPMTALSTVSFYLILRKRYIEAGVSSGLAYFTKFNSGFFLPGFLLLIFRNERKKFWPLLRSLTFFFLPILAIYLPDASWRELNIPSHMNTIGWSSLSWRITDIAAGTKNKEYLNSYLTNPIDLVKYFGLVFLFLLFLHFFRFRKWDRKEAVYWIPVISYLFAFMVVFGFESDIRYILPIVPFMVVLLIPSLLSLGKKWQVVIIGICILQFISTTYYVHQKRQIPPEIVEGFEYIRQNVAENALILYPEENLLIYGQRRMIWIRAEICQFGRRFGLEMLFWAPDHETMNAFLRANHIDHILIKKSRIYDDSRERHLGGYPESFVKRLSALEGWVKVFENRGLTLWKRVQ